MQKILSRSKYKFLVSLVVFQSFVLLVVLSINYSASSLAYANSSLGVKDSIPTVAVELEKMNVVYAGLDNPITVAVSGIPNDKVIARVSGGWKLDSLGNGSYLLTGGVGVRVLTLSIYVKGKIVGARKFRVRPIPFPKVKLGTLDGTRPINASMIGYQRTVYASLGEGFGYYGVKYQVTSYTAIAHFKDNNNQQIDSSINVKGSSFVSASYLTNLLDSGDMLTITNVKAIGPDGEKELSGITIHVR